MTDPHHPLHIPGRAILREVVQAYQPYRDRIAERATRVLIVRFTPGPAADDEWATRMEASAVSAQQKVRLFTALGAHVESLTLPDRTAPGELIDRVQAANDDPRVTAVIVQSPPPVQLRPVVNLIDPGKDIDALGVNSPRPACATADGIVRVAEPFLSPDTTVAVVGARGFVGGGVTRLRRAQAPARLGRPAGDDLRQLLDVDVVLSATGRPHLLTAEYLHRGHLLVVDSGFVPHPDGPRGDVAPDAARAPAAITPVPGGIGPVEMAVLAERLILTVEPELSSWRYVGASAADEWITTAHQDVAAHRDPSRRPSADTAQGTLDRSAPGTGPVRQPHIRGGEDAPPSAQQPLPELTRDWRRRRDAERGAEENLDRIRRHGATPDHPGTGTDTPGSRRRPTS